MCNKTELGAGTGTLPFLRYVLLQIYVLESFLLKKF